MSQYNFVEDEDKVLSMWNEKQIFKKAFEKESPNGEFVFFEGPPTANAPPALHHVIARVFKDVVPRYKTMRGFRVDRKAGWDTHGLPVELQAEKKLGISGKPQIENIVNGNVEESIKKFNAECREMVWGFLPEWNKLTERIGFWLDLNNPYVTYENEYIESIWWIFKQIWDKGLVYKSYKIVLYCPRCGTPLSSHEVAQGYDTVKDTSVVIKFPVEGEKNTYILSWTTTPWTLPGNVALAVGENMDYVYVKMNDETLILGKNCLNVLSDEYEIIREIKGKDLVGIAYKPLFDILSLKSETAYKVYSADFVTDTDGTGVVHTAVMYGEDDYVFGEQVGLPKFHTVDLEGKFVSEVPEGLFGMFVKDDKTEKKILDYLSREGLLFQQDKYEHEYPFCWRCKTPLLYYARDSWFIRVSDVKDDLIKNNQKINWEPSHIKDGRFGEWLLNIRDWAISRERYWGTPMPIWECECGERKCVGSRAELGISDNIELHRPYVDKIELDCVCGKKMKRIEEVLDVWFDSGAMPIAQWGFPYKKDSEQALNNHFPADFISEAIDQTRGWFYTLLAISTLLEKGAPYKNVICLGHIQDANGEKMSKSKGNIVDPWEVIRAHGADALRWCLFSMSSAGEPKRFDLKVVDQAKRRTLMILWNVFSFYELYKNDALKSEMANNALDKWILARLNQTIVLATESMDAYDVTRACRAIHDFINDLSTWYIRRSRARFKAGESGVASLLRYVLINTAKLLAPFTPFIAERLYAELGGEKESVHLDDWPVADSNKIDEKLLRDMQKLRDIVEIALSLRAEAEIKIRQPLSELFIKGIAFENEMLEILKDEVNVKNIVYEKRDGKWIEKEDNGVIISLNIELGDELKREGLVREIIRTVNSLRKNAGLTVKDKIVLVYKSDGDSAKNVFNEYADDIKNGVLADSIEEGDIDGEILKSEFGDTVVGIRKI